MPIMTVECPDCGTEVKLNFNKADEGQDATATCPQFYTDEESNVKPEIDPENETQVLSYRKHQFAVVLEADEQPE